MVFKVSAVGMGTWALGGPFWAGDQPLGWGEVDDEESVRAVRRAFELGVTFFDTADVYGTGHAEEVLGRALAPLRSGVVIATKWGNTYDAASRQLTGSDASPGYVRRAVEASLRRLGTDYIDVLQLHIGPDRPWPATSSPPVRHSLRRVWCARTDGAPTTRTGPGFAAGRHCAVVRTS